MIHIEIYTKKYCIYCHRAKELFTFKKVFFQEIPIDNDKNMQKQMIERSGLTTVPQIFINGKHIGGYDDLYNLDIIGHLDILLNKVSSCQKKELLK